jgi:hypothetical protein
MVCENRELKRVLRPKKYKVTADVKSQAIRCFISVIFKIYIYWRDHIMEYGMSGERSIPGEINDAHIILV